LRRWLATLSDNPEEVAEKIGLLGKHRVPGLPGLVVAITTDEPAHLEAATHGVLNHVLF
jgi:hypothetical protein